MTQAMWTCLHGVDGREACDQCMANAPTGAAFDVWIGRDEEGRPLTTVQFTMGVQRVGMALADPDDAQDLASNIFAASVEQRRIRLAEGRSGDL